jgi:hypothetical protein
VTLCVYSARMGGAPPTSHDLDVTRKTVDTLRRKGVLSPGEPWAPSWAILRPALDVRERASACIRLHANGIPERLQVAREDATAMERAAWERYVPAFIAEMRRSYVANRAAWDALLGQDVVVLRCFCTNPDQCHRAILRTVILPRLGAVDCGEVPTA